MQDHFCHQLVIPMQIKKRPYILFCWISIYFSDGRTGKLTSSGHSCRIWFSAATPMIFFVTSPITSQRFYRIKKYTPRDPPLSHACNSMMEKDSTLVECIHGINNTRVNYTPFTPQISYCSPSTHNQTSQYLCPLWEIYAYLVYGPSGG